MRILMNIVPQTLPDATPEEEGGTYITLHGCGVSGSPTLIVTPNCHGQLDFVYARLVLLFR